MLSVLLPMPDVKLNSLCRQATEAVLSKGTDLSDFGVPVGIPDRVSGTVRWGAFQGDQMRYPASTVKLFWLAYTEQQFLTGKLKHNDELDRALTDMIVESVNDATALVVDAATGTTGGPALSPGDLKKWMDKRQAANKWFGNLGYTGVNACQKTWNEGPYGRERQGYGPKFELRNSMSPLAGMRLLSEIMMDRIVNPAACESMRKLLYRSDPNDGQRKGFIGAALPEGAQLWSKAGWTDIVRHDLAWVRLPDGKEFVFAIFTEKHSGDASLIPAIAKELLKGLATP